MGESRNSGRNSDGTFAVGNPGKPKGSRHKATMAVEKLMRGSGQKLTEKAIALALEGDTVALRLCLERIAPIRKDAPVSFALPDMANANEAAAAARSVLASVANGELSPSEGAHVMGLVETYRRTLETTEIERRIEDLERGQ